MNIISRLIESLDSPQRLLSFVGKNHIEISDCFQYLNHNTLIDNSDILSEKLLLKASNIEAIAASENILFEELVTLILTYAIRTSDQFLFDIYFKLARKNEIQLPKSIMAASHYMIDYSNTENTPTVINEVVKDLVKANEDEEHSDIVLMVICNLFSTISARFPFNLVHYSFSREILNTLIGEKLTHLSDHELLRKVYVVNPSYGQDVSNEITALIDELLQRNKNIHDFEVGTHLIENQGEYYETLSTIKVQSITDIRNVAVVNYKSLNDESIFYTLGNGVTILEEEKQLYTYLFSYGLMHMEKITSCFASIEWDFFDKTTTIYDWGCGQGLGSLQVLSELIKKERQYSTVVLVEPSKICIKRASLHISQITQDFYTINKDFDSLELNDFPVKTNRYFHILSNILDVEFFSLNDFIELIKTYFKGNNYFMIVSPKINIIRSNRIDSFMQSFEDMAGFKIDLQKSEGKYQWIEGKTWTREVRIFKVEI